MVRLLSWFGLTWPLRNDAFFFRAEGGIRGGHVTGVQTCALPILGQRGTAALAEVRARVRDALMRIRAKSKARWSVATTIRNAERGGGECRAGSARGGRSRRPTPTTLARMVEAERVREAVTVDVAPAHPCDAGVSRAAGPAVGVGRTARGRGCSGRRRRGATEANFRW